jgi:hypothetical protein
MTRCRHVGRTVATEKLKNRRNVWDYIGYGLLGTLGLGLILPLIMMFIPIRDLPPGDAPTLWIETVKRGEMSAQAFGLGTLTLAKNGGTATAVLEIRDPEATDVRLNQRSEVETGNGDVQGHVSSIGRTPTSGPRKVEIALDGVVPANVWDGASVTGTINIATLKNVVYVGRPVHGEPNTTVSIFKLDATGKAADRVWIKLGRAGSNAIEILEGLQPGDKVILSDMSMWENVNHVVLN